ncbi:hypothetical protein Taro_043384 [Colocasia esculenta]|uniref:Uncharacterized protein n=1 Tax=Colocasia esculenta TaxID=4460 RepID=A0A843X415_COLES|nr:hypothetical protein [Colocasia esculenta]
MGKAFKACKHTKGLLIPWIGKGTRFPIGERRTNPQRGLHDATAASSSLHDDALTLRTSRCRSAKLPPPERKGRNLPLLGEEGREKGQRRGRESRPRLLAFGPQNATRRGVALPTVTRRPPTPRPERAHPGRRDNPIGQSATPATLTGVRQPKSRK